jgi:hypothetical protein
LADGDAAAAAVARCTRGVQEVDRGTLDVQKVDCDGVQEVDRGKLDL